MADRAADDFDLSFDTDFQTLSAGEQLIFNTSDGSLYVEVPRQQSLGLTLYPLDGESLPGPIPTGLVLEIVGDEYPAFPSVSVPDVAPLTGVTPASPTPITAETVFRWDADDDPDAYISISASATGFRNGVASERNVDCLAVDDGEFAFPTLTQAELGDFSTTTTDVSRVGATILRRGNTLLYVGSESLD